jgi:DNA-3-methyladenine glycosylase I
MVAYRDDESGVPVHDDARLFELLTLEGAQSGLSWSTILNKRDGYRAAFAGFDVDRRGFRFVGPTTVRAFMQAAGHVDDHVVGCFRHRSGR